MDRDSLLKEEYFKLQDQYEDYDRRALQIKGWIGGGAVAVLALGIGGTTFQNGIFLLLIATISATFWYLETKWKLFQYALSDRIRIIEAHFRQDEEILFKDPVPLQIYNWWFSTYSQDQPIYPYEREFRPATKRKRYLGAGFQTFVHLPYSLIILWRIVLFALKYLGLIS